MASGLLTGLSRSTGGFFKGIFALISRSPKGFFLILAILILLGGTIVDAIEQDNPAIFFTEFTKTFALDSNLKNKVDDAYTLQENNASFFEKAWALIKILGIMYIYYYLFTIILAITRQASSNQSLTGILPLLMFFILLLTINVVSAVIQDRGDELQTSNWYKENTPGTGIWYLVKNYEVWLTPFRSAAEWWVADRIQSNTTNQTPNTHTAPTTNSTISLL